MDAGVKLDETPGIVQIAPAPKIDAKVAEILASVSAEDLQAALELLANSAKQPTKAKATK
jgi:hypothetical protein